MDFHFEYYRTCFGDLTQRSKEWFCTRPSEIPGGLAVEPLARMKGPSTEAVGGAALLLVAVVAAFQGSASARRYFRRRIGPTPAPAAPLM